MISQDHYGTVDDYMEIIIQFGFISLFGMTFPLCFLISFVLNILELQTDKLKLMTLLQRPIPITDTTIGIWNDILDFISYLGMLNNTFTISYLGIKYFGWTDLFYPILLLLVNFTIKFVLASIVSNCSKVWVQV